MLPVGGKEVRRADHLAPAVSSISRCAAQCSAACSKLRMMVTSVKGLFHFKPIVQRRLFADCVKKGSCRPQKSSGKGKSL
jgi:hypothetical protein